MTTPYLPWGQPDREGLTDFYPEWAAPPSSFEADLQIVRAAAAEASRARRRRRRHALLRPCRRALAWLAASASGRLRLPSVERT